MATLGWIFLAVAFLMLIMVANNSAQAVWQRITGGSNLNLPERKPGQISGPF